MDNGISFQALAEMSEGKRRETLIAHFSSWAGIGDSDIYDLTRVKEAFELGIMEVEDFREWDKERIATLVDELLEAFPEGREPQETGWVRVEEKLPEPSKKVLAYLSLPHGDLIEMAYFMGEDGWYYMGVEAPHHKVVTHWMALPLKPMEGEPCRD